MLERQLCGAFVALVALTSACAVSAQSFGAGYGLVGAPMSSFLASSYLTQQLVNDLHSPTDAAQTLDQAAGADATGALVVTMRGPGPMAARLAAHYPKAQRPQAEALFAELLQRYAEIESQFGIPHGDLGGSLAALVAGGWMGLHDAAFPDAFFPPLVRQMRALLAAQPGLPQTPEADRRDMYEQTAILGMLMATTQMGLQRQPDAATKDRLREAAKGYLETLFKAPAERVRLGPGGVSLR